MIDWPADVINAIARRRAVLFLGSGVSRNAMNAAGQRPPLWGDFLKNGIRRCRGRKEEIRKLLDSGDYLTCCQLIKQKLGHEWIPFLNEQFFHPEYQPKDIHKHIFELDAPIILTPNFDKIYDNYAAGKVRVKKYHEDDIAQFIRGSEKQRLIIKIHGCIDSPGKLVFTREDYANIRNKYDNFYRTVEALILTNTFIFIGCGGADPDISLLLEQYARSFQDSPPNYFVTSGRWSNDYKKMMTSNYNLVPLFYSGENEHADLTESLKDLVPKVDERRQYLSDARLW